MISNNAFSQKKLIKLNETEFSIGKTIEIQSKILKEKRTLNIYFPESYNRKKEKKYNVIYLLDGSKNEDIIHISGLVQFCSFSWINQIPETIVVGISNIDRKRDFTYPSTNKLDQKEFPTSGKSENFINFIEKELEPFIESNYRTTNTKTLIGQSLGGLLVTEILFKKPHLFDNYIIISPSLWWDNENLLKATPKKSKLPKSVYVAVGKEGEIMERTAKELFNKLSKNKDNDNMIFYNYYEDKTHADALHSAVYDAFIKIFKKKK